jgi:hypothetical protein
LYSVGVGLGGSMRGINYALLWLISVGLGLLALNSYPQSDLAGAVLCLYVFVASTAVTALIHFPPFK